MSESRSTAATRVHETASRRRRQRRRARRRPGRRHRPPSRRASHRGGARAPAALRGGRLRRRAARARVRRRRARGALVRRGRSRRWRRCRDGDDVLEALGALLRRMHDAQAGFDPHRLARAAGSAIVGAPQPRRGRLPQRPLLAERDLPRRACPIALIDWDLAAPAPRLHDLASAANYWVAAATRRAGRGWGRPDRPARRASAAAVRRLSASRARPARPLDVAQNRNRDRLRIALAVGGRTPLQAGARCGIATRTVSPRPRAWFEAHRREAADGSMSLRTDHRPRHRLRRPRHGGAAAGAARERRARRAARRHGHVRALGRPTPLRRVPPRPGRLGPGLPRRDAATSSNASASTASCRSPRSTSRASRRTATRFPVPVLVSPPDTIHRSNDKAETYALLHRIGVPAPAFRRVNGAREVEAAAHELGYPDRPVCFKPVFSSGSRGFRVLDPTVDRAHQLLNERPGSVAMRLDEALELLPDEGGPDLLVMELATGGERTIDGIADGARVAARASEDPRGDARRARHVLRHARGRRADGDRRPDRGRARRSSTSSTSSSSATT